MVPYRLPLEPKFAAWHEALSGSRRHFGLRRLLLLLGRNSPRMAAFVNSFQGPNVQVRVDRRRRNISVPEQLLNNSKVTAVLKQVSCKAVPEQMRVNLLFEP